MGEVQGSIWTTILFITLFFGMVSTIFLALDIMNYNSTLYTVEDNLRSGNLEVFDTLGSRYNKCPEAYTDKTDCSGILEINEDKRYIKYQLSYDGRITNYDVSGEDDAKIVMLPY